MSFNTKGSSLVDYVLAKQEVFESFGDVIVGKVNEFSDHVPIDVSIKMNQNKVPLMDLSLRTTKNLMFLPQTHLKIYDMIIQYALCLMKLLPKE